MDNLSIPSGATATTINEKVVSNHNVDIRTWHFGPNASDTNTYELNWPLVVPQSAKLYLSRSRMENDSYSNPYFPCYQPAAARVPTEELARHQFPDLERFARIYVDGIKPLAEWLLDNSSELSTAFTPATEKVSQERIIPAQMIYTFTVLAGIGADASLSLVTAKWNPIGLDVSGSTQLCERLPLPECKWRKERNHTDCSNAISCESQFGGAKQMSSGTM